MQLGESELRRLGDAVSTALDGTVKILLGNYYDAGGPGVVFEPLPLEPMFL